LLFTQLLGQQAADRRQSTVVVGCRLLVVGCWLLVVGFAACRLLSVVYTLQLGCEAFDFVIDKPQTTQNSLPITIDVSLSLSLSLSLSSFLSLLVSF